MVIPLDVALIILSPNSWNISYKCIVYDDGMIDNLDLINESFSLGCGSSTLKHLWSTRRAAL